MKWRRDPLRRGAVGGGSRWSAFPARRTTVTATPARAASATRRPARRRRSLSVRSMSSSLKSTSFACYQSGLVPLGLISFPDLTRHASPTSFWWPLARRNLMIRSAVPRLFRPTVLFWYFAPFHYLSFFNLKSFLQINLSVWFGSGRADCPSYLWTYRARWVLDQISSWNLVISNVCTIVNARLNDILMMNKATRW